MTEVRSYFSDAVQAYGNLTQKPLALFILVISVLSIVAETNSQQGPWEIIQTGLKSYIATEKSGFLVTIATVVLGIVSFIVTYKATVFYYSLLLVILLAYPESKTGFTVIVLAIYLAISSHSALILLLISQLTFIYFNLSSNFDRLITFIFIITLAFGTEHIGKIFTKNVI